MKTHLISIRLLLVNQKAIFSKTALYYLYKSLARYLLSLLHKLTHNFLIKVTEMKKILQQLVISLLLTGSVYSQNTTVQQVINSVNIDTLIYFVRELSGDVQTTIGGQPYTILSRHKNQPGNDKSADYIKERLQYYGLTAVDQWWSSTGRNVYASQTGTDFPNRYFIICAHYDDMPSGTTAPGADDNASGTAAVLEAARILYSIFIPIYNNVCFMG
jgi:hypothetical protein